MAKEKSTAVTKYDERFAQDADVAAKELSSKVGGQFLSIKSGGIMYLAGKNVPNNHLAVVVAAHVFENAYYTQAFDPDNPATPTCFAFGTDEATMVPHEASAKKQAESCAACPHNKFPSKDDIKRQELLVRQGKQEKVKKGKACKNLVRLALLPGGVLSAEGKFTPNEDAESYETAVPVYHRVSVTSARNFALFVTECKSLVPKRPPYALWAMIKGEPDPKNQAKTTFTRLGVPGSELSDVLIRRHDELQASIDFPYQGSVDEGESAEPEAAPAKGKRRKY